MIGTQNHFDLQSRLATNNDYVGVGKNARCYFNGSTDEIYAYVYTYTNNLKFCFQKPVSLEMLQAIADDAEKRFIYQNKR